LIASIEALLREQAARARNRESGGAAANCRGSGAASLLECESGHSAIAAEPRGASAHIDES
jgi:hypothetical protein